MTFLKQVRYVNIVFLAVGVLLLLVFLVDADTELSFTEEYTNTDLNETKLNGPRIGLMAWELLWLAGVTIGFLKLASVATNKASMENEKRAEAFEPKFFKFMIGLLVFTLIITLVVPSFFGDKSPIVQFRDEDNAIEIQVTAIQYNYYFNDNRSQTSISLKEDTKYVFIIKTTDTTHGFGLFDSKTRLLGQIQIVPGFPNDFVWEFSDPGLYTIKCMEYCGASHHEMDATITVN